MQKKTNKKTQQVIENTSEIPKQKSILKPFIFFALFVAMLGAGMLYPYLQEQPIYSPMPRKMPPQLSVAKDKTSENVILEETPVSKMPLSQSEFLPTENVDLVAKDKLILSQTQTIKELNEKIHRLEIDNLNLSEKMAHQEKLTPLTIKLMEEIYSGRPFGTTLNLLLMYDKTNDFALNVKDKLSDYAPFGLPTAQDLKQSFLSRMEIAKKSYYINKNNSSWNQRWTAYFKSLVHIYPEKMNPQDTHGIDLIFLAHSQVADAQFEEALKSIEKLPENVRQFFNEFAKKTQLYLEGKQIIDAYLKK